MRSVSASPTPRVTASAGAIDNATGVATVLELAACSPLARSRSAHAVLRGTDRREEGLLGAATTPRIRWRRWTRPLRC